MIFRKFILSTYLKYDFYCKKLTNGYNLKKWEGSRKSPTYHTFKRSQFLNYNSTLLHAQVINYVKHHFLISEKDIKHIDVRVYPSEGAGFYLIPGHLPNRWYFDEDPTDAYTTKAALSDVQKAINTGNIQIVNDKGVSYGLWNSWEDFCKEVLSDKAGTLKDVLQKSKKNLNILANVRKNVK